MAESSFERVSWTDPLPSFILAQSDMLVQEIKNIKFLVIDEADRMIENGHFAELENIVRLTRREQSVPPFTSISRDPADVLLVEEPPTTALLTTSTPPSRVART